MLPCSSSRPRLSSTSSSRGTCAQKRVHCRLAAVNQAWEGHPGLLVENVVAPPQGYSPAGVTVPTSSAGDFDAMNGASTSAGPKDKETSGANIRTGKTLFGFE